MTSKTNMVHHSSHNKRQRVRNENPSKPNVNLVEGNDLIVVVVSQALFVANVKEWVVDSGATMHICATQK
ncbi:hypothetical protein L6164_037241 [Bauhinia variegata]|uniref:Uncharacterized protein n=1 Tax=Bauhinia variegata TaxID=167791 RepID=A0ACB9KJK5_BAUVA|nr:hypothetical protein L6164_037241 [Bauhinia variegata]